MYFKKELDFLSKYEQNNRRRRLSDNEIRNLSDQYPNVRASGSDYELKIHEID